ncbi:MAG: hypothetical protein LBV65_03595, partial [Desulfovibrio sp.]|nr:hypothetical protein [Desulfovibrio sp.]
PPAFAAFLRRFFTEKLSEIFKGIRKIAPLPKAVPTKNLFLYPLAGTSSGGLSSNWTRMWQYLRL